MSELYELPDGWEWKTLTDIFTIQRGGSPRPIKEFITDDEDGINWIKIGDTVKGEKYITSTQQKIKPSGLKKSRLVVEGDFIMSNSMSFGRPYIVKTKGAIHDGWLLMREKIDNTDKDFFYYLLSSNYMYQQFTNKASGTTVKNLNIDLVKSTNIPLPPLPEQQRIVTKLDNLFDKIDKAIALHQKNMDEADVFMGSVLNDVFGELEERYSVSKLSDFASFQNGYAFKSKEFNTEGIGLRVIRIGNVLDLNKNPVYIDERDEFEKYLLKENDIVISMTGTRTKKDYLFVRVVDSSDSYLNQRVGKIVNNEKSNHKFLYYFIQSSSFRDKIFKFETGAVNQGNMSGKDIMNSNIANVPLVVQQNSVSYLDQISEKIEKVKSVQEEKMDRLKALKASILDRAFRGEL